jgi:hypothetical protein
MNKRRRKWLMAAGLFLGVAAGSAPGQQQEIPAPAPRSLPAFVLPQNDKAPEQPATGGCDATPSAFRDRAHAACRKYFIGYPDQFGAVPLGYDVHLSMQTQVVNGEAARMVLYHFDFVDHSSHLTLRGRDQLHKMAAMLDHNFFPIVIERTPCNPALAEARRMVVLHELANGPFPVPPMRVIVAQPEAIGLQGREANLIYLNMLRLTLSPAVASPQLIQGATVLPSLGGAGGGTGGTNVGAVPGATGLTSGGTDSP